MKYLGEKSLSSFLSGFCHACWYIVLVAAVLIGIIGSFFIFTPEDHPAMQKLVTATEWKAPQNDKDYQDWVKFKNMPIGVRLLVVPYFVVLVVLTLKLIRKAREIFGNFSRDIVFNPANVVLLRTFSKLLIPFSILTFNISSLVLSLMLFLVCEILKNGTVLQEEHDLTV
jgi:hypothetical protein